MYRIVHVALAVVAALWAIAPAAAAEDDTGATVVLDCRNTFWRFRTVRETEEVLVAPGKVDHVRFVYDRSYFYKNPTRSEAAADAYKTQPVEVVRLPAETSSDWMKPTFDDSTWLRARGPVLDASNDHEWKLILMRGQFEVTDPARAGDLTLSLTFRGGAVVYLNGEELTRAFMPRGAIDTTTPAEPYPTDVYLSEDGFVIHRRERGEEVRLSRRIRTIADFTVPASKLRKGVNLLAIAIHRSPTDPCFFLRRTRGSMQCNPPHNDTRWAKLGLIDVRLVAPAGAALVPNVARPEGMGFVAWNASILRKTFPGDYPDPFGTLRPIRITGVRNGTFAGQVVVANSEPIRGLSAQVSDLTGPISRPQSSQGLSAPSNNRAVAGSPDALGPGIPASRVEVRYARPDGQPGERERLGAFDALEAFPPDEVPVYGDSRSAVQPIWLKVHVPADARPGDYAGTVTIRAEGIEPVTVPLALRVIDWTLPDPNDFTARMDIVESPESLAMAYEVPLWSDEHLKLLDKTFALLAPLAVKTVYVTAIRRTHFGNEHAVIRWVRDEAGELQPDFSIMEKYLEVATRHLGAVPGVILYCWEPMESMGHAGGAGGAGRTHDKPILITVYDPETGAIAERKGPAWGTPESKAFWKRLTDGIQPVLKKRGLEGSLLFGLVGDCRPTKQGMDEITTGVPGAKWAIHSHYYCVNWQGYDMGMTIALWGVGSRPVDPSQGYGFGWSNPFWIAYYPREMSLQSTLVEHRTKLENWMGAKSASMSVYPKAAGTRGLGRLGADFWVVLKDQRGQVRSSLAGRYPESYWGQLNLNYGIPYLLGRGKDGPVPTVRSEGFRENIQEVEARVYLERALLDEETKALMGEDLAGRCRKALDERIRMCLDAAGEGEPWFISSDWNNRTEALFSLAAEVARRLGGRQPNPDLKPEPAGR